MRRPCFPNSGSHQHGPPLLGRVRTPPRSPTSTLVCSPPTPSLPSVAAPVSPRQRPTSARRACSSPLHRCPRQPVQRRRLFYPRLPVRRLSPQGETRGSQVPGPSSSCVPWSKTPPGATAPRPLSVRSPSSSSKAIPWTPGNLIISWLFHPRPTRSRTYASPNPLPSPAQGSLPARAGSPLAGRVSHPQDDKQGFMKSSHTPFLLDQPCLVALPISLLHFHHAYYPDREARVLLDPFGSKLSLIGGNMLQQPKSENSTFYCAAHWIFFGYPDYPRI